VAAVLFEVVAVDQDIVKVGGTEYIEVGAEDVIDEVLEGGWGICESERHNQRFEEAIAGTEGGFPFFAFCYSKEVVGTSHVELGIDLGLLEAVKSFLKQGKGVSVTP
jgi:hypothetical protein